MLNNQMVILQYTSYIPDILQNSRLVATVSTGLKTCFHITLRKLCETSMEATLVISRRFNGFSWDMKWRRVDWSDQKVGLDHCLMLPNKIWVWQLRLAQFVCMLIDCWQYKQVFHVSWFPFSLVEVPFLLVGIPLFVG